MNRRDFMLAAAAAAVAGCATDRAAAPGPWAPIRDRKKVRVVQWGMRHEHADGKFGSLKKLPDDFELVGIVDDTASKTLAEKRNFKIYDGVPRLTPEQVWADRSIGCVLVEVTNDDLIPVAKACAQHGLAMHLDKPCGQRLAPFVEVVEICRQARIPLQIGYMFRVNPAVKFCQRAVREKWIGEVNFVEADMNHCYGSDMYEPYISSFAGGLMYNLGCHLVDFILPMFGDMVPVAHPVQLTSPASAGAATPLDARFQRAPFTNGAAILEWKHGMAMIRSCSKAPGGSRRLRIDGTKGSIDLCPIERFDGKALKLKLNLVQDAIDAATGKVVYAKGEHIVDFGVQADRYAEQLRELARIVRGELPVPDTYDHDIAVHKTTLLSSGMPL